MNQYAVYYLGPCSHQTHVFGARVGILKVFFCGQRAVSIIEEQRDQSGVLGTHVCTRLPVAVQVKGGLFLGMPRSMASSTEVRHGQMILITWCQVDVPVMK